MSFLSNLVRGFARKLYRRFASVDGLQYLIDQGLVVGSNFSMQTDVIIDPSHCWHVRIGNDVTLAPRVYILAHDASTKRTLNYTRIGKVTIGDRVFIGAGSIVMPGVTIGSDVVIGAGSVVTKDIPERSIAAGNPARVVANIDDFIASRRSELDGAPLFGAEYAVSSNPTGAMKQFMNDSMKDRFGYIV